MNKKGHMELIEDIKCLKRHDISMDAKPGARSLLTEPRLDYLKGVLNWI